MEGKRKILVNINIQRIIEVPANLTDDELEFAITEHNHEALSGVEFEEEKEGRCLLCCMKEDSSILAIGDDAIKKINPHLFEYMSKN